MEPHKADFIADMAYGVLIIFSIVLLNAFQDVFAAGTFAFGILLSYIVHIWWKMARFDPEWMTEQEVREKVEDHVEAKVEETVAEHVDDD